MEKCGLMFPPPSSGRAVKSQVPEHYLQNMDCLGLQQLEHLEKELEQAKQKDIQDQGITDPTLKILQDESLTPLRRCKADIQILVLKAQEHRETSSPDNKVSESRYWTNEERQRFKKALKTFGTDFAAIAKFVGTRSSTQVRTHAQKYYAKLIRDYKRSGKAGAATMKGRDDVKGLSPG